MANPSVVVLGGGLSGIATAYTLAHAGYRDVTLIERGAKLGGLAGSFQREGHYYPLGYHHIIHLDKTLLFFLDLIGALRDVRWRRIRMYFQVNGRLYDLAHPVDFLRFPMSLADKARFARLMARAFLKKDWSDWLGRSGADLVRSWAGAGVLKAIFEPLSQLKFELPAEEVSGAWLGARLNFREGSAPLGYIPGKNWTDVLCDGVTRLLNDVGVRILAGTTIDRLQLGEDRVIEAVLAGGDRIGGDIFVSSIPTEVYCSFVPQDRTPNLASIRYSALISAICATRQVVAPDFYWMLLASLDRSAGGLFMLSSLNPTIGEKGDVCLNFVTHLRSRDRPFFKRSNDELWEGYAKDFHEVFGARLQPFWTNIARVPMYSPVFYRGYQNPPVRSTSMTNVYFAGNYRTFPSITSTGTALASGLEAGEAILRQKGQYTELRRLASTFRLRSMQPAPARL